MKGMQRKQTRNKRTGKNMVGGPGQKIKQQERIDDMEDDVGQMMGSRIQARGVDEVPQKMVNLRTTRNEGGYYGS